MCGRIGQFSAWQSYIEALKIFRSVATDDGGPRFNIGPGTRLSIIRPDGSSGELWWGYRPHWAVARKIPQMINARADKIVSATWKPLLKSYRVIVPADCWYEWLKAPDGKKQPYLLRASDGTPLFFAALCSVSVNEASGPRPETGTVDGMVIVTDKSDAGMIDIHDRRPVALTAEDAALWLDSDTSLELAAQIAQNGARPISDFEWFEVSRELNDVRHDGPDLIKSLNP